MDKTSAGRRKWIESTKPSSVELVEVFPFLRVEKWVSDVVFNVSYMCVYACILSKVGVVAAWVFNTKIPFVCANFSFLAQYYLLFNHTGEGWEDILWY